MELSTLCVDGDSNGIYAQFSPCTLLTHATSVSSDLRSSISRSIEEQGDNRERQQTQPNMRPSLFFTTSLSLSPNIIARSRVTAVRGLHAISRSEDGTVVISPSDETHHSATVVLCHGLGDTAEGWVEPTQVCFVIS